MSVRACAGMCVSVCVCEGVCVQQAGQYRGGGYPVTASGKQYYSEGMSHMQCYSASHTHNKRSVCVSVVVQQCMAARVWSFKCVYLYRRCVFTCVFLTLIEVN